MNMENINYVVLYIFNLISVYLMCMGYSFISNRKFEFNVLNVICLMLSSLLLLLNNTYNIIISRVLVTLLILIITYKIIFKFDIRNTIIYSLISYSILVFFDFVFSFVFYFLNAITVPDLSKNYLIVGVFTLLVTFITIMMCKTKFVGKMVSVIIDLSKKSYFNIIITILTIFFMIILSTKLSIEYNLQKYFFDLLLLILFLFLFFFAFFKNYHMEKEKKEKETLQDFITKYEKIIDENRINKHEMLNNLIILKSFDDKNTKEYNDLLDELIVIYGNDANKCIKNISKLPSGLKGILYYKIDNMKKKNINLEINISKRMSSLIDKLPINEFVILSKILGIVMDNACEGAIKSKDKFVFIEIYEIDDVVIININNSYDTRNKFDINNIKRKDFSTKGEGRGLGLYLANRLLKKSKRISMEQSISETFNTKITIK